MHDRGDRAQALSRCSQGLRQSDRIRHVHAHVFGAAPMRSDRLQRRVDLAIRADHPDLAPELRWRHLASGSLRRREERPLESGVVRDALEIIGFVLPGRASEHHEAGLGLPCQSDEGRRRDASRAARSDDHVAFTQHRPPPLG